jgi:hypothetical protein
MGKIYTDNVKDKVPVKHPMEDEPSGFHRNAPQPTSSQQQIGWPRELTLPLLAEDPRTQPQQQY